MKLETLEQLMSIVYDAYGRIKDEEFSSGSPEQVKLWKKDKTVHLLELQGIMNELSEAIQEHK